MRRILPLLISWLAATGAVAYATPASPVAYRGQGAILLRIRQNRPLSPPYLHTRRTQVRLATRRQKHRRTAFLFGDNLIRSTRVWRTSGAAAAFLLRSAVTGRASSLEIYLDRRSHAHRLIVGLYSDHAGPTNRVATGSLVSPQPGSWNTIAITGVRIASGQSYWLTVLGRRGVLVLRAQGDNACGNTRSFTTKLASLPRRWRAGRRVDGRPASVRTLDLCDISAYVVGTVDRHGIHTPSPPSSGSPSASAPPSPVSPPASTTQPLPAPPSAVLPPSISGSSFQGTTLMASHGWWLGNPTSYTYQWQDCGASGANCRAIAGATQSAYVLTASDLGYTIDVVVTATNSGGSTEAVSPPTGAVANETYTQNPGNGLSTDSTFFPIMVWYQGTSNVAAYKSIGVNTFVSPDGYSSSELATLKAAGMLVIECSANGNFSGSYLGADGNTYPVYAPQDCSSDGRGDPSASIIKGWMDLPDEPDTAQSTSSTAYGPCIAPSYIQNETRAIQAGDDVTPKRAVMINFNGDGVVLTQAPDRGSFCDNITSDYAQYMQGATIASFDMYPRNYGHPLDSPSVGVSHLHSWLSAASEAKPVIPWLETTPIHSGATGPTAADLHFEIWSSIIAGADGVGYFCHIISPTFNEAGCLSLPSIKAQMSSDDALIESLAPVLNSDTPSPGVTASASYKVDVLTKRSGGYTYAFADADAGSGGSATFAVPGGGSGTVTVLGEGRTLPMVNGTFSDAFGGYGVHIYQIQTSS